MLAHSWRVAAGSVLLAGCATTSAPVMQELGPSSYMVTVRAEEVEGGKKAARRRAVDEAVKACTAQGKHMHPTHMTGGISDFVLEGEIELNFRCEDHPSPDPY